MQKHGGPIVLIIDNAPCHANVEQELLQDDLQSCQILRLSPYSPMFNAIEHVWNVIKSNVKGELAAKVTSILEVPGNGLSIKEQRLRALEELINNAAQTVTAVLCANCIAGIQNKVASAINLENMVF